MKVLLVGNGGREHALGRTLVRTSNSVELHVQAGNPGLEALALGRAHTFDPCHPAQVTALARDLGADLVVVGPEAPLVAGVADAVTAAGIACFGPSRAAAQLEASKSFAKDVMAAAGVPTARAFTCTTMEQVRAALDELGAPHVVKDDALAAGKGVVVTDDRTQAEDHAAACLNRPGGRVVIEDFLDGPEVSLFCLSDGTHVVPLVPAQDFKRLRDGNEGPNTGGMGAYTPLPWLPDGVVDHVVAQVTQPTITEMARRGTPFVGLLYCGLAMTSRGVQVVEFNARFGDPETQAVLERLESPLADVLFAAATEGLGRINPLLWSADAAVTVVEASAGYPASSMKGVPISGLAPDGSAEASRPDWHVIHAGTARTEGGQIVTAGGRVLNIVGRGATVEQAREAAYRGVQAVTFDGMQVRRDIATWPADLNL